MNIIYQGRKQIQLEGKISASCRFNHQKTALLVGLRGFLRQKAGLNGFWLGFPCFYPNNTQGMCKECPRKVQASYLPWYYEPPTVVEWKVKVN